jgi:small GTP-binding protein
LLKRLTRINSNSMSDPVTVGVPTIAIVGRPNVGKSTLFNRIVGSRRAIVGDEPGITRDRLYGEAHFRGHRLRIVDTGGIEPEEKDFIPAEIFRQAKVALEEADAIILVVDGRSELTSPDLDLARLLIRGGKPLFLAVNKIDSDKQQSLTDEFHRLGIRKLFPISAEHGRGVDDVLEAVFEALKLETLKVETSEPEIAERDIARFDGESFDEETQDAPEAETPAEPKEVKVAIIGHPNVGKSTLLNRLTGTSRAIVSPIPGTTRDAVDEVHRYRRNSAEGQNPSDGGKTFRGDGAQASRSRGHRAAGDRCHRGRQRARRHHRRLCPRERPVGHRYCEQVGSGDERSKEIRTRYQSDAHSRKREPNGSRGVRTKSPLRPEIPELRAGAVRLCRYR